MPRSVQTNMHRLWTHGSLHQAQYVFEMGGLLSAMRTRVEGTGKGDNEGRRRSQGRKREGGRGRAKSEKNTKKTGKGGEKLVSKFLSS